MALQIQEGRMLGFHGEGFALAAGVDTDDGRLGVEPSFNSHLDVEETLSPFSGGFAFIDQSASPHGSTGHEWHTC